MKHHVLFSLKSNEKYIRLSSAAVVTGALKLNLRMEHKAVMRPNDAGGTAISVDPDQTAPLSSLLLLLSGF